MLARPMRFRLWAACHLVLITCGVQAVTGQAPNVSVRLSTPKESYVLGEPVLLDAVVTNTGDESLRMLEVVADPCVARPEVKVFISGGGRRSPRWMVSDSVVEIERNIEVLGPGARRSYRIRVLYDLEEPTHLAFPRPNDYSLWIIFPFVEIRRPKPARRTEIESNGLEVHVRAPTGRDATLWHDLQAEPFLKFVQFGAGDKRWALKAAELLSAVADSSYHDDLRWALAKYYYELILSPNRPDEQVTARMRKTLGLEGWPHFRHVTSQGPADRRLDYNYVGGYRTDLGGHELRRTLERFSRQTGVPLRSELPLQDSFDLRRTPEPAPLRVFMLWVTDPGRAAWFYDGDGYVLKPIEPALQHRAKAGTAKQGKPDKPEP